MWLIAGVAGALAVATGWLPWAVAEDVAVTRAMPVLGFLAAVTVLAELSDRAGVFDSAAAICARLGRGSTVGLFGLVAVLATVTTITMSLDTTAVLLTPVVLTLVRRLRLAVAPFALLVVWLANVASLLLPVSNLTNLLAAQRESLPGPTFAAAMALPELVVVVVAVGFLALVHRRDLAGRYAPPVPTRPADPVRFWTCAVACTSLIPAVLSGAPPWACAGAAALVAIAGFAWRDRTALRITLVPWRILVLVEGLLLVMSTAVRHGLGRLLVSAVDGSGVHALLTAAVAGNIANNLPAYLAVEPAVPVGHTGQLLAVLVGSNAGPLITSWGSLATLLWRERCRAYDVPISGWRFALLGLGGAPLILLAAAAVLPG